MATRVRKKMLLCYTAGPYTAATTWEVKQNILAAERAGAEIAKLGDVYPVIPHLNTPHWEGLRDGQYFIDGTFQLMSCCHALFVIPNDQRTSRWEDSVGTTGEIKGAKELGIPVFYNLLDLRRWVAAQERKSQPQSFMQWIRKHFYERT